MRHRILPALLASAFLLSACAAPMTETPVAEPPVTASTQSFGDSVNSANSLVLPLALVAVIVLALS
ncbi:hypothetical protein HKCCE3408_05490 [Rhodobacterales bacterium HKCCE3408]|nr:hypothetical protein [Rhodobacterales bacterium HKCCE3408]